jgi:4-hydroxy-2-oxoheptanedioate aldolase
MQLKTNMFKQGLLRRNQQIGLWCTLSNSFAIETVAGAGYDWLLLDTEHSPGDVLTVLSQLQALSAYDTSPVVRPASGDPVLIKRYLDLGVQTLLIPQVESAAQARSLVAATRYPPAGIRGVSALTRATQFGRISDYAQRIDDELCLLVQVESVSALDAIEEIAAVEGIDGIFVGPGDLAASFGLIGQLGHIAVTSKIEDAITRIIAAGKPAGILTTNVNYAKHCMALGTCFTAVGIDAGILARGAEGVLEQVRVKAN